jgi:hypothetical protein
MVVLPIQSRVICRRIAVADLVSGVVTGSIVVFPVAYVFVFADLQVVIAGGDLLRGHRQSCKRRRRAGVDDLPEQLGHRVARVVGQRPVERHVGERAVALLPGDESELSLASGDGAREFLTHRWPYYLFP